jgi:beta-N-acetylhexosaminidase
VKHALGQHVFIGISGKALTNDEKKFIVENNIGGVTLFGRNCESPEQIHSLCSELQSLRHQMRDKAPLFIGIDMEGGRVARLKAPFTQWPPLKKLGDLNSPTVSFSFGFAMGRELKAVGINLDYAPCIDVFSNPTNPVIGDRALSSDPEIVAKHATALIRGYIKSDIIPCAKHFPGHGDTKVDSHLELPVEDADLERIQSMELVPFKKAIRARLQLLMSAHIKFPNIDPEWPATFSEIFMKKILRDELRYQGLAITDDLGMKALTSHYPTEFIPVRALQAGCDLLLYCNEPAVPPQAIVALEKAVADGTLQKEKIQDTHKRILAVKAEYIKQPDPMAFQTAAKIIGLPDHYKLSQAITDGEIPQGLASLA